MSYNPALLATIKDCVGFSFILNDDSFTWYQIHGLSAARASQCSGLTIAPWCLFASGI